MSGANPDESGGWPAGPRWPPPGPDTAWWRSDAAQSVSPDAEPEPPIIAAAPGSGPPRTPGAAEVTSAEPPAEVAGEAAVAVAAAPERPAYARLGAGRPTHERLGAGRPAAELPAPERSAAEPVGETPSSGGEAGPDHGTPDAAGASMLVVAAGPAGERTPARPKAITHREMPAVASPRDAEARSAAARAAAARRRPSRSAADEAALLHALFHQAPTELATSLIRIPEPRIDAEPIAAPVSHRRPRSPRSLPVALPTLMLLAFAAAFFAWVSAMPIWLAVGHAQSGTATVTDCPVHGIPRSCATFLAADHSYTAWVTLLGPASEKTVTGQTVTAEMASKTSSVAYTGSRGDLYLRLGAGLGALLACGAGIVWATGALRFGGRRARMIALTGSFAGPLLLLLGMLAATF